MYIKQFDHLDPELAHSWQALKDSLPDTHVFQSPAWLTACLTTWPAPARIVAVYDSYRLVALAPLVWDKLFGLSTWRFPGSRFLDRAPLLAASSAAARRLASHLSSLGRVYLPELSQIQALDYLPSLGYRTRLSSLSPFLLLESDPLRYVSGPNKKHLRKYAAAGFDLGYFQGSEAAKRLEVVFALEKASFKTRDAREVFHSSKARHLFRSLARVTPDSFALAVLNFASQPVAEFLGFVTAGTFQIVHTCYNLGFSQYSPGKLLAYLLLAKSLELGHTRIDFSRGASNFKAQFTPDFTSQQAAFHAPLPVLLWWQTAFWLEELLSQHTHLFNLLRRLKHNINRLLLQT